MRCEKIIIEGVQKGKRRRRLCFNTAQKGSDFCKRHAEEAVNIAAFASYGAGNGKIYNVMQAWKAKHAGKVWNCTDEVALLRTLLQIVVEDLTAKPAHIVLAALPKLTAVAGEIGRIGEKHAKIEDGLRLKIEFTQLQEFVAFIVGLVNRTLSDDKEKETIAEELEDYIERLQQDD